MTKAKNPSESPTQTIKRPPYLYIVAGLELVHHLQEELGDVAERGWLLPEAAAVRGEIRRLAEIHLLHRRDGSPRRVVVVGGG